jgi:hypothetical protein
MFNHTEILNRVFGDAKAATPKDVMRVLGIPLLSMGLNDLTNYHKRFHPNSHNSLHSIYRSCGVYVIEFPTGVYVGSVGGGSQYFGRRWKQHTKGAQECMKDLWSKCDPSSIWFHAMAITHEDIPSRMAEFMFMAQVERVAPHFLLNPKNSNDYSKCRGPTTLRKDEVLRMIQQRIEDSKCPMFE